MLGLDRRSSLLASFVGRGGKYGLDALLVLALGDAAMSLTAARLYGRTGVVAVVAVAAYRLRRWCPFRAVARPGRVTGPWPPHSMPHRRGP